LKFNTFIVAALMELSFVVAFFLAERRQPSGFPWANSRFTGRLAPFR
jgi:hypothetical protein